MSASDNGATSDQTGKMIRLEKATVGINAIAGVALAILIALVADVRGSISRLSERVEATLRDVAVIQSQQLDARVRDLERRVTTTEAQRRDKP